MNICFIGIWDDFSILDEGMIKTNFFLVKEISKNHDVLTLNIFKFFSASFWKDIRSFNPDIIQYTCGGSLLSFLLLKIISIIFNSKTIMMTLQPHDYNFFSNFFISKLSSDIILSQTQKQCKFYEKLGFKSLVFPSGVDTEEFRPVDDNKKNFLRDKYSISREKFIILHVGHIKKGRNLEAMKNLLNDDTEILVVGSPSFKDDNEYNRLKEYGFNLLTNFIKNINEIYALSDCYIFPVFEEKECISMPLSVLEAMACNLPVISSKFGDLDKFFFESDGLFFINKENEVINCIHKLKKLDTENIRTREKVSEYSWKKLGLEMNKIYNDLKHKS